jgi:hypothetical protein
MRTAESVVLTLWPPWQDSQVTPGCAYAEVPDFQPVVWHFRQAGVEPFSFHAR